MGEMAGKAKGFAGKNRRQGSKEAGRHGKWKIENGRKPRPDRMVRGRRKAAFNTKDTKKGGRTRRTGGGNLKIEIRNWAGGDRALVGRCEADDGPYSTQRTQSKAGGHEGRGEEIGK